MTLGAAGRSIRLRLLLIATTGLVAALAILGVGLVLLFSGHVERRAAQELDVTIAALAGQIVFDPGGAMRLAAEPADPAYGIPLSGRYWQVRDEADGRELRSRSLWDGSLALAPLAPEPGRTVVARASAPDGSTVIMAETTLILNEAGADRQVRVAVAMAASELDRLQRGFARDLMPALIGFGAVLLAGAWLQVGAGLRPLAAVREGLTRIRGGNQPRLTADAPAEIAPLVGEINALLDEREAEMERARNRAADLAHGMKTPLTALAADAARLRALGQVALADSIDQTAGQMRRTIERELARARVRPGAHGNAAAQPILPVVEAVTRTLARTPDGGRIRFDIDVDPGLRAAVDTDDLHDLLGNLLENAVRAARFTVAVSAMRREASLLVTVEDDGPGLSPQAMQAMSARGARLDQRGGAGLGLAIVSDILAAYGSAPQFALGRMGGVAVSFSLPADR